ncbi:hypothetical protein AB0L25_23260 [Spirillospora sp. NPDC052242]
MRELLDACVALNLVAADAIDVVADALGLTFVMASTAASEVRYVEDVVDGERIRTEVRLEPHVTKGTLELTEVRPGAEMATFVDLTAQVDDGEAATLAMAVHRGLPVVTDDRAALRAAARLGITAAVGTAGLLRRYEGIAAPPQHEMAAMLVAVERRACFRPGKNSPDFAWWTERASWSPVGGILDDTVS